MQSLKKETTNNNDQALVKLKFVITGKTDNKWQLSALDEIWMMLQSLENKQKMTMISPWWSLNVAIIGQMLQSMDKTIINDQPSMRLSWSRFLGKCFVALQFPPKFIWIEKFLVFNECLCISLSALLGAIHT